MININDPVFYKAIFDEKPNEEIYDITSKKKLKYGMKLKTLLEKALILK